MSALVLVGTSHHAAPIELREKIALDLAGAGALAQRLADGGEAVCLSTCNRTELYLAAPNGDEAQRRASAALVELAGLDEAELVPVLYRLRDEAAALHLFRVAAGLDSLVPGEGEILGQVKDAFEAGAAGSLLDHLFRQALHVGKKVRTQTAIAESPASVPSAAAALAQHVFGDLAGRRVLVVGAGDMAESAARNLSGRGATIAWVANRTLERAQALAERFGAAAATLDELESRLVDADVVVSCTSAPGLVLDRAQLERVQRSRRGAPLFLVDLAVPRDLDPAINDLEGCYLYNVDDLQAVVVQTLAGRRQEAARAEGIVTVEADAFLDWQASLEVVPAIASLRAHAEEIRQGELARAEARLGRLSDEQRNVVEALTAQIVNKLLHLPTVRMKQAAAAADGVVYADAVRHLFGLGEEEQQQS
ncbi:MAG: glutamyl-tRNA reductase [Gaiellaceae bacterium]|nr:glutamyl-tRNA reductase [Gaiellaceae bacterium]